MPVVEPGCPVPGSTPVLKVVLEMSIAWKGNSAALRMRSHKLARQKYLVFNNLST